VSLLTVVQSAPKPRAQLPTVAMILMDPGSVTLSFFWLVIVILMAYSNLCTVCYSAEAAGDN